MPGTILNLATELMIVPSPHQFKPYKKNGRFYERGAYDTKAAVMILLFNEIGHTQETHGAHHNNERVNIAGLDDFYQILKKFLTSLDE